MKITFFKYISINHRKKLYKLLADLLDDGVPLFEALNLIGSDGEKVYGKSFIKHLTKIIDKMKSSSSVTDVLAGTVPPQYLTVINAAERSGQLSQGLRMLVAMVEKQSEIVAMVRGSMMMPIVMFIVVLLVIMGYSIQVFPTFIAVLPVDKWPGVSQGLYGFGNYLAGGGILTILGGAVGIFFLIRLSMPLMKGELRTRFIDPLPPYSYFRIIQLGMFLRMLSTLLLNGIPMLEALNLMKERASPFLNYHLGIFTGNMKAGRNYKDSFDSGFLTHEMLLTVKIYAGMDSFSETVRKMAEGCDLQIHQDIQKLSGVLKNVSLVTLALAVVWIFGAIFSLVDKLGSSV